ncbi:MAG: ABC transporter permease subunit, partial [Neisseria mucosa]|nr:ABC transporter permease subunit [Neisseria mucosa]
MSRNKIPSWLTALILLIALPLTLPFLYVAMRSWQVGATRAYELLFRPRMFDLLGNTLMLMFGVTLISIVLGITCAVLFQRYRFFGKTFFQTAITLPLCIPAFVSCFTWISLTFRVEGFWGTVMIMSLSSFPLAYLPVEAALKRVSLSFEEVSLSLGKSRLQTFFSAILPQLKPAIGSSILLIALHMLIEFGAVSILNYPTFTTAIFQEYEMSFDNNTAALLSAVLLVICGLVVFSENIFRGKTKLYHSGKGVIRPYPVKPLKLPAQIAVILFISSLLVLSIVIPFGI